jgi:isoquinoline 1-oxidoreductase subunit beta
MATLETQDGDGATPSGSRRKFLQQGAAALGGLVIGFSVPAGRRLAQAAEAAGTAFAPNAFLRIGSDDTVKVLLAHSEMGQGVWTSLPMLIAEELDADWSKITVEHAPAAREYYHLGFGQQGTGGSTTIASEFDRYRQAGATARALLVQAAAKRFGVPAAQCRTESGSVIAGEKRARYGELAEAAAKLPVPKDVPLKDPKRWTLIGKPTKRLDTAAKVTGKAQFGLDVQFDGLLTAVVERAPVFGAKVKSFSDEAARAVPGVRHVVQIPNGVAVVADHFWAAKRGRDALKVEWELGVGAEIDTARQREEFSRLASTPGARGLSAGKPDAAFAKAKTTIEADYWMPYLAHACMEPLNCTVKVTGDEADVWVGTQFQTATQQQTATALGLKPENVRVHTTFLGGGFGRRAPSNGDFVNDAAHTAKAIQAPVKVVWTREDDMRGGSYRAAFLHRMKVGLDEHGQPSAWTHVAVGQSIAMGTPMEAFMVHEGVDHSSVEGAADSPYLKSVPNHHVSLHSPRLPLPVLWWRSVGHSHTAFAMESLIDELAHAAGKDPLAYRRTLLAKHPRHLGVLELAAEKAGWGSPLPAGRARGIAVHSSFGSYVAQVAEVSLERGKIKVERVVCAVDCGVAVNPETINAQVEGAIVFGLSAALHSRLSLKDGHVEQSNFHDFRVLRLSSMPKVEVHILPSTEKPTGVGEPGLPPVAPAVANALFVLTGQRLRELPLKLEVKA